MSVATILKAKGSYVFSVTSKSTVYDALVFMSQKNIGALLVIDDGKLTGILSERDNAGKLFQKEKNPMITWGRKLMKKTPYP